MRSWRASDNSAWLVNGDAFEWLAKIHDESVDLVITDPPYESLEKHRSRGTTTRLKKSKASSNEWFQTVPNEKLETLCNEAYRILKPKTHFYIFCDDETSDILKKQGTDAGFYCWKRLVWEKGMGMGYHYRASYEFILFFEKGRSRWNPERGKVFNGTRQLNNRSHLDILKFKRVRGADAYPTEKPEDLLDVLVTNSTQEDEVIVDPFMGSGVTGASSVKNGRVFWGCDLSEESMRRSVRRIKELT